MCVSLVPDRGDAQKPKRIILSLFLSPSLPLFLSVSLFLSFRAHEWSEPAEWGQEISYPQAICGLLAGQSGEQEKLVTVTQRVRQAHLS